MLTMLVEVIMSVFIANFKASEHPITNIVVRGILIMIAGFCIGLFASFREGGDFSISWALMISFIVGIVVSLLIFLIEIFANYLDKK
ncbi:hypothetical protein ACT4VC_00380 [Acinetobacter baumannii]